MVFKRGDPKTIEAGRKGGKTGVKHLTKMTKRQRTIFAKKGNKRSLEVRRARKERDGLDYEDLSPRHKH